VTKIQEAIALEANDIYNANDFDPKFIRNALTRIARLAAEEAVRFSNSEYEIYRDGVPGRLIELTVAALLGEDQ